MNSRQLIFGAFLSLAMGSIIYVLFRATSLKMFTWFSFLGLKKPILNLRIALEDVKLPDWFLFALPDGLWLFSFMSLILFVWKKKFDKDSIIWLFSVPIIAVLSETLQAFHFLQGTFDVMDLLMYSLGTILPFVFYKNSIIINLKQV